LNSGQCPVVPAMSGWDFLWWMEAISGRAGHCSIGPDNVRLEVFVWDRFGQKLESLDLIIFNLSTHPFL
jgi:hypothetical protein